jgi:hypothetical protein
MITKVLERERSMINPIDIASSPKLDLIDVLNLGTVGRGKTYRIHPESILYKSYGGCKFSVSVETAVFAATQIVFKVYMSMYDTVGSDQDIDSAEQEVRYHKRALAGLKGIKHLRKKQRTTKKTQMTSIKNFSKLLTNMVAAKDVTSPIAGKSNTFEIIAEEMSADNNSQRNSMDDFKAHLLEQQALYPDAPGHNDKINCKGSPDQERDSSLDGRKSDQNTSDSKSESSGHGGEFNDDSNYDTMSRAPNPHSDKLECMIHNFHKHLERHFTQGGETNRMTLFEDDPLELLEMIQETRESLRRDVEGNIDKMGMMMAGRQASKKNSRRDPLEPKTRKMPHQQNQALTYRSDFSPQSPNRRRMAIDIGTPLSWESPDKVIPAKRINGSGSKSNSQINNTDNSICESPDNPREKARKKTDVTTLNKGLTEGQLEVVNSEEEDFNATENDLSQDLLAANGKTKDRSPKPVQKFYTMTDALANQI